MKESSSKQPLDRTLSPECGYCRKHTYRGVITNCGHYLCQTCADNSKKCPLCHSGFATTDSRVTMETDIQKGFLLHRQRKSREVCLHLNEGSKSSCAHCNRTFCTPCFIQHEEILRTKSLNYLKEASERIKFLDNIGSDISNVETSCKEFVRKIVYNIIENVDKTVQAARDEIIQEISSSVSHNRNAILKRVQQEKDFVAHLLSVVGSDRIDGCLNTEIASAVVLLAENHEPNVLPERLDIATELTPSCIGVLEKVVQIVLKNLEIPSLPTTNDSVTTVGEKTDIVASKTDEALPAVPVPNVISEQMSSQRSAQNAKPLAVSSDSRHIQNQEFHQSDEANNSLISNLSSPVHIDDDVLTNEFETLGEFSAPCNYGHEEIIKDFAIDDEKDFMQEVLQSPSPTIRNVKSVMNDLFQARKSRIRTPNCSFSQSEGKAGEGNESLSNSIDESVIELTDDSASSCLHMSSDVVEVSSDSLVSKQAQAEFNLDESANLLASCAKEGDFEMMKGLFKSISPDNVSKLMGWHNKQDENMTLLHYACIGGNLQIVRYLIEEKNLDINAKDCFQYAAVMRSLRSRNYEVSTFILEKTSDKSIIECCLGYSIDNKLKEIVDFIATRFPWTVKENIFGGSSILHQAVLSSEVGIVSMLLDKGADASICDANGETPLHIACLEDKGEMVPMLLEAYGEAVAKKNIDDQSPMDLAVEQGNENIIRLLSMNFTMDYDLAQ